MFRPHLIKCMTARSLSLVAMFFELRRITSNVTTISINWTVPIYVFSTLLYTCFIPYIIYNHINIILAVFVVAFETPELLFLFQNKLAMDWKH